MHDRGGAAVFAAALLDMLYDSPINLHWRVDLRDRPTPHPNRNGEDPWWDALLERLHVALKAQPSVWEGGPLGSTLCVTADHVIDGRVRRSTFACGFPVNVQRFAAGPPPVGYWQLVPAEWAIAEQKLDPPPFWWEDIPF